ncbi:MAG: DUF5916 domain-containing protein [Bacteroidota bacterium]
MRKFYLTVLASTLATFLFSTEQQQKSYTTAWTKETPSIDGILDDPAWEQVEWGGGFVQLSPEEGIDPSEPTQFKILYDAKNLYIAIKVLDSEPNQIVKRMSRRDGFEGDWIEVNIDSYNDKRTAFSFNVSASGVKGDEYVSNNGDNWDSSWDPIWYTRTTVDQEGWNAEMRIPLSQLRFADKENHTWGLQFTRRYFRNEERSTWQPVSQNAPGWVHLFGELNGIKGIKPQHQLEIQPYVVGRLERFEAEEGNPFANGREDELTYGVDGKIGITSDITLDFTINPDFGQVEADPSQVNLSAFQLFFREQRPFFIEGNNILDYPVGQSSAGGNFNNDNLFYSRRIGRRPQGSVELDDDEFEDKPGNTRIWGAAKLTGKNKNGFSWGILEAITSRETAEVDSLGDRSKQTVEPFTNYFVARAQQDIDGGETVLGVVFTSTNRRIRDKGLEFLHRSAYSGGIDVLHNFQDRKYFVSVQSSISHVRGTPEAITETQEAAERFFQRPDVSYASVDTTRTSLTGTAGTLKFGKNSGKIIFETGMTYRSPSYEINDLGFLVSADNINQWTWGQYRILEPFSIFRSVRINANQYLSWDFGGRNTYKAININTRQSFKNFWNFNHGVTIEGNQVSNSDLRGGPGIVYPGGVNYWYWFGTDSRKRIRFEFNQWWYWGFRDYASRRGYWASIRIRASDALNFRIQPSYSQNRFDQQYVDTQEFNGEDRYITGSITRDVYRLVFRVDYNITPNLTLQYYGQPFVFKGRYNNYNRITDSRANEYANRFAPLSGGQLNLVEDVFEVDEDSSGGDPDYSFDQPDFNLTEFQSNMVLRWEYKPGSELFLVWAQNSSENPDIENERFGNLARNVFRANADNAFLLKFTYRFVL